MNLLKNFLFILVIIIFNAICSHGVIAKNLGESTKEWHTEIWHYSGGYWKWQHGGTYSDFEVGKLTNDKNGLTDTFSKNVTIKVAFSDKLNQWIDSGENIGNVICNISMLYGNTENELTLNGFNINLDENKRKAYVTFSPKFNVTSSSIYHRHPVTTVSSKYGLNVYAVYDKYTSSDCGECAFVKRSWITGLEGYLYNYLNPLIYTTRKGMKRVNDLRIGLGVFRYGGAAGYNFRYAFKIEYFTKETQESIFDGDFDIIYKQNDVTDNINSPCTVDSYPALVTLSSDFQIENTSLKAMDWLYKKNGYWAYISSKSNTSFYIDNSTTYFKLLATSDDNKTISVIHSVNFKLDEKPENNEGQDDSENGNNDDGDDNQQDGKDSQEEENHGDGNDDEQEEGGEEQSDDEQEEQKENKIIIEGVNIEGYWNHFRGQEDIYGRLLPCMPHRFLSLETIKVTAIIKGDADWAVIRFSPELEAMEYTNKNGQVYSYKDDFFGYEVLFPQDTTFNFPADKEEHTLEFEYALPLAPETITIDEERKRQPYWMKITAGNDIEEIEYIIDDIDITSNIYNMVYIQPE